MLEPCEAECRTRFITHSLIQSVSRHLSVTQPLKFISARLRAEGCLVLRQSSLCK